MAETGSTAAGDAALIAMRGGAPVRDSARRDAIAAGRIALQIPSSDSDVIDRPSSASPRPCLMLSLSQRRAACRKAGGIYCLPAQWRSYAVPEWRPMRSVQPAGLARGLARDLACAVSRSTSSSPGSLIDTDANPENGPMVS